MKIRGLLMNIRVLLRAFRENIVFFIQSALRRINAITHLPLFIYFDENKGIIDEYPYSTKGV
jgi:hypothetical protein